MDQQRRHDSLYPAVDANADGGVNQQTFDYIDSLMQRARKGRVIERNSVIKFEAPDRPDWRAQALADLREWMLASNQPSVTAETWAAVYIRCGRCLTEWRAWCEANPITDLATWIDAASEVVAAKRWI
jgi:hypothetical protein